MDNKIEEKKIRHSNMELLRIVAMSFIMLHHFWCHGMLYKQFLPTKYLKASAWEASTSSS